MRRYYERPELPQEPPRAEPDPNAAPTPRPDPPKHDFHAKVAQFGSTPALLRRLGLAVDVVLDGLHARGVDTGSPVVGSAGAASTTAAITSPAAPAVTGARVVTFAGIARTTGLAPAAPLAERSEITTPAPPGTS